MLNKAVQYERVLEMTRSSVMLLVALLLALACSGIAFAEETASPQSDEESFKQTEDALELTRAQRRKIQSGLNALGFQAGPDDGIFGSRTRQAIRLWQQSSGSQATGYLKQSQADALAEEGKGAAMAAGQTFRDCDGCPKMVVVPGGTFTMGSPASEEGRFDNEGPQHRVSIATFAVGVYELTRGEYRRFINETGYSTGDCLGVDGNWRNPGFSQSDQHPVVCVRWGDAKAYVRWLGRKTGHEYRLLSEAEWEYAARAGTRGPFHFGSTISTDQANYDGNYVYGNRRKGVYRKRTTPSGIFPSNGFGVHDMHGNVWEWVEDCWHDSYVEAPGDGRAWTWGGDCDLRVRRGGSWYDDPRDLRSAFRNRVVSGLRLDDFGFRVARTLAP